MVGHEYPLDDETISDLRKVIWPKESADHDWKLDNLLIAITVKRYLDESSTLEEFIRKLGEAGEKEDEEQIRAARLTVKARAEKYLRELERNR